MGDPQPPREVRRRLAMIKHAEEVTGNVAAAVASYGNPFLPGRPSSSPPLPPCPTVPSGK
jgi:hypothetical protein